MGGQEIFRESHKRGPQIPEAEASPSRGRGSERFDSLPTHLPGVLLRVEPGENPNLSDSTVEGLLRDAIAFKNADAREKAAKREKNKLALRIGQIINPGGVVRGIISEPDDTNLTGVPKTEVTYDPDLLRHSLSAPDFTEAVEQTIIVEFPKPIGVSQDVVNLVISDALREIRSARRATITTEIEVNEKVLARLVKLGRRLLPGARKPETTISLVVGPAVKNPPQKGGPANPQEREQI